MSIASEIERLQAAKAAIRAAIQAQGVVVGSELTLSDYAARIALIEGGAPVTTAPDAMTVGQWSAEATVTAGEMGINITALPSDGGSAITSLEYRVGTGGTARALTGTGTGLRVVTQDFAAGVAADIQVRAVNAIGSADWSDTKTRTPASSGSAPVITGSANTPESSWGTTLSLVIPAGMGNGDHLIAMLTNYGQAVVSISPGTWKRISGAAFTSTNNDVWVSTSFATPPSSVTVTFAADSLHRGAAFSVSDLAYAAAPVAEGTGTTAYSADPRAHSYTTTVADSIVCGVVEVNGGGVTGTTGTDGAHTWVQPVDTYTAAWFATVRATAGSYSATVGPVGNSSASEYWWIEVGS
jgi:hypothetical protein